MNRYTDESFTLKPNMYRVKRGDQNLTRLHIPPKNFVCCIPKCSITNQMFCGPHRNETSNTRNNI